MVDTQDSAAQQTLWRITKAATLPDGTMTWQATTTKFSRDVQKDLVTRAFYEEAIDRFKAGKAPPPFFSVAHYPCEKTCVCGYVYKSLYEFTCTSCGRERLIAGIATDVYIDGDQPKAKGVFFPTVLGKSVFESCAEDISQNRPIDERVRISMGFYPDSDGVVYKSEGRDFLKGWIEHYAATRVPVVPETELEVKSLNIKTKYDDAAAIIPKHLADKLEELEKIRRVGKSSTDPDLIIKSDKTLPTKEVDREVTPESLNAAAQTAIKNLKEAVEENPERAAERKSQIDAVLEDAAETLSIVQKAILAPGGDKKEILTRASNLIQAINDYAQAIQSAPEQPGQYAAQPHMYGQQIPPQTPAAEQKPQEPPIQAEPVDDLQTNADLAQNQPDTPEDEAQANSQNLTDQEGMQQAAPQEEPAATEEEDEDLAMTDDEESVIDTALASTGSEEEEEPEGLPEEELEPSSESSPEEEEPVEESAEPAAEEEEPAEEEEYAMADEDENVLDSILAEDDTTTDYDRQKELDNEPNEAEVSEESLDALEEDQPSEQEEEEEETKGNKLRFTKKSRSARAKEVLKALRSSDSSDPGEDEWEITEVSATHVNRKPAKAIAQYLDEWGEEENTNAFAFNETPESSAEEIALEDQYADEFLDTETGVNSVNVQPDLPNGWASVGDRYISQAGYRGRCAEIMIESGQKWRVIRHPGPQEELNPRHITVLEFGEALELAAEWIGGPLPSAAPPKSSIPVDHAQVAYTVEEKKPTGSSDVVKARTRPSAAVKSSAEHPARAYMDRWSSLVVEAIKDSSLSRVEKRDKVQKALEKFGTEVVEIINKSTPISQPDVELVVEKAVQDAVQKVQAERDQRVAALEAQVKSLIETAVQGRIETAIAYKSAQPRRRSFGAARPPENVPVSKSTAEVGNSVAVPVLGGDTQPFKRFSASELAQASVMSANPVLRY